MSAMNNEDGTMVAIEIMVRLLQKNIVVLQENMQEMFWKRFYKKDNRKRGVGVCMWYTKRIRVWHEFTQKYEIICTQMKIIK